MNDRELLELAAKAAGVQGRIADEADCFHFYPDEPDKFGTTWAPLTDDGDALRLAVRLGFTVQCEPECVEDAYVSVYWAGDLYARDKVLHDPLAVTRRAIVRAAAEIGRAMP